MKNHWKSLGISILIPLVTGGVSALLSGGMMSAYDMLRKPPLSPAGWLFPAVWTILYILMGIGSWLIYQKAKSNGEAVTALLLYGTQLLFLFVWPIIFFRLKWYFPAFVWLVALLFLIIRCIQEFGSWSRLAAGLMIPYLIWVIFAGYLNLGVLILN